MKMTPELEAVLSAGERLSNIAFNLSQDDRIDSRHRKSMKDCQTEWDAACRAFRAANEKPAKRKSKP